MVAVDEHELDALAGAVKVVEQARHDLRRVSEMKRDVGELRAIRDDVVKVDGVHPPAVRGDAAQAAAVVGPDFQRYGRLELRKQALERGPFTERHLPG